MPFILFDLKSHKSLEKIWVCLQSMLKIVTICYSSEIRESDLVKLEYWVKYHLDNMTAVFGIRLKPKHHYMTHYANIVRKVGPLVHMSTMRFEAKHKEFTKIAKSTNNFRNINKTLTIRYQETLLSKSFYIDQIDHGKLRIPKSDFFAKFENLLQCFPDKSKILHTKYLKINSHYYQKGLFVKNGICFFQILEIFKHEKDFHFICNQFDHITFDEFLNSVEIKMSHPEKSVLLMHSELRVKRSFEEKRLGDSIFIIVESLDTLPE